jgi:AraC-like DNA-binding protein
MFKTGHPVTGDPAISELGYRNPVAPGLSVEAFTLAELRQRVSPEHSRRPWRLEFHQIVLITSGHGRQIVDFIDYPCDPGTLLWTRPGQVEQRQYPPDLDGHIVLFTDAFLPPSPALRGVMDHRYEACRWQLSAEQADAIGGGIAGLARDYATACAMAAPAASAAPGMPLVLELLRHQLMVLLLRIVALPRPDIPAGWHTPSDDLYQRFRALVERHYAETRQVDDYATLLGYSARTLNRACRAATSHSAKEVIDRRVILEARRLLAHSDLPAAAIAHRLGFAQATNFGKYFTHHVGASPGDFRLNGTG